MATFRLTQAELAVLTQHMIGDALSLNQAAQADLATDAEQLRVAEENLLERGLLVCAPLEEEIGVSSEIAAVLATTLFPETFCALRVARLADAAPPMYFSFTTECMVCNYVDAEGQHVFAELTKLDDVLNKMLSASGVLSGGFKAQAGTLQPLDALVKDAQSLSLLMVVTNPAQPQTSVRNLSWLTARGSLWLVDPSSGAVRPQARSVDLATLRETLTITLTTR